VVIYWADGSAVHQREDASAEVFALVSGVSCGRGGEFRAHLACQFVAGIGVEPAADVQPLRGGVPVPAVLAGEDHLHDAAAEVAEPCDQVWQREEVVPAGGVAAVDGGLVGRFLAPVGLADQHRAAGLQAVPEEVDRAGTPPPIQVAPMHEARPAGSPAT
jgi:hypothetical protein